jgi:hypothetical protein
LNSESETAKATVAGLAGCDPKLSNREDGSCVDYAYVKVYNNGEDRPVAKKRFYLRIK